MILIIRELLYWKKGITMDWKLEFLSLFISDDVIDISKAFEIK